MTKHEKQASKKSKITDKIFSQIMTIRDSGKTNMLDIAAVQRLAYDNGFYELVCFIEKYKSDYWNFITYGIRG